MIGTAGLPHVIVRFFTVPRVRDARMSAGWALLFIAILYTTAPAVGALARLNLTETIQRGSRRRRSTATSVYEERPEWFRTWEDTGLLEFDRRERRRPHPVLRRTTNRLSPRAPRLRLAGQRAPVDRDIIVLANPEIAGLPELGDRPRRRRRNRRRALDRGRPAAGDLFAAVSHDLLKGVFRPGISDAGELSAGRAATAVAILFAGYLGYNPPGFVAQVVALAFGLAAASLFPATLLGIFSLRVNKQGAIAGMITGLVFTIGYIVWFKGIVIEPLAANTAENWLFGDLAGGDRCPRRGAQLRGGVRRLGVHARAVRRSAEPGRTDPGAELKRRPAATGRRAG